MRAESALRGLGWMILAQLCFAAMNVFTRLSGLGAVFTYLLALPLFPERPAPWQRAGSLLELVATALVGAFTARPRLSLNP